MSLEEIRQARLQKLTELEKSGINPYPMKSKRDLSCAEAIKNSAKLIKEKKLFVLAGRIVSLRRHGGSIFLNLRDGSGEIQLLFKKDTLGNKPFQLFKNNIDTGDFIQAEGTLFITKTEELTLEVKKWKILAKALRSLPDKWHGLKDKEIRFRKRYLDLLTNPAFKKRIELRSKIISFLRSFLDKEGFLEVETPILQNQAGGALANPFKTKLDALDIDLYLRIAPELYLKRLLVGGLEKVYELGRCFRNEGIDFSHNPEFTELEFYWAYCDYQKLMDFTEKMIKEVIKQIPDLSFSAEDKKPAFKKEDFIGKSLPKIEYQYLFKKITGMEVNRASKDKLENLLKKEGIKKIKEGDRWALVDEVFKKICLKEIDYPFFLIHHPLALSPLAKKIKEKKDVVARFQLIISGMEIVNAYSEINSPLVQKKRFEDQQKRLKQGEKEVHPYDKDFVEALEHGMPPTAGWGMGIDRFIALLTGSPSLKEVIAFPLMRPRKGDTN